MKVRNYGDNDTLDDEILLKNDGFMDGIIRPWFQNDHVFQAMKFLDGGTSIDKSNNPVAIVRVRLLSH